MTLPTKLQNATDVQSVQQKANEVIDYTMISVPKLTEATDVHQLQLTMNDIIDNIPSGSTPVISSLNVTPTTSAQTITAPSGTDGYSPVNVSAVTSAIDQNISAGNIKSGVSILGVTGTYTGGGSKYGCTMDSILGDTNSNGVLQPSNDINLVFTGVEDVAEKALWNKFYNSDKVKSVSFPDLTSVSGLQALRGAFSTCANLTNLDLSELETVTGGSGLENAFSYCTGLTSLDLSNLTTVNGSSCFSTTFSSCSNLASIDLSNLTTVAGSNNAMYRTFNNCTKLVNVTFPSLTTVTGTSSFNGIFYSCTALESVSFPSLTTIGTGSTTFNQAFYGCSKLSSIDFSDLEVIGADSSTAYNGHFAQAFRNCTLLTSITFPELTTIYCTGANSASVGTFYYCDKIQKFYFPKLTTITYGTGASSTNQNACKLIFSNCSSLTEIHFGRTNQSAIQASAGYSTLWGRGAGNATVYFDL